MSFFVNSPFGVVDLTVNALYGAASIRVSQPHTVSTKFTSVVIKTPAYFTDLGIVLEQINDLRVRQAFEVEAYGIG